MTARASILLSPYRPPAQNTLYLADDDVAAFLNGHAALWHPAALFGTAAPPRLASPYDHEQPGANHLYAAPVHPPLLLAEDWERRLKEAGAQSFAALPDRSRTLANLLQALRDAPLEPATPPALLDLDPATAGPFLGVGFGHLMLEALCEAMAHDNPLAAAEFWLDVSAAVAALAAADAEGLRRHLEAAAERLRAAREVLYPVALHLVDLFLPEESSAQDSWAFLDQGLPVNLVACAASLERLSAEKPERLAGLKERVEGGLAEVCGGPYLEREDALLPVESQLWNLAHGQAVYRKVLGREVKVFGRKRFGLHPQTPLFVQAVGIPRALFLTFDEAVLPAQRAAVINWPSPDGKQVEAFARGPLPADSPQTFFHLAYHLHQTIMQDQAATLALVHRGKPDHPGYEDWVQLSRLAPVLGCWATLSDYLNEVLAGDYTSPLAPDEFYDDYLVERVSASAKDKASPPPVSGMADHVKARRRLDTAWTLTALERSLAGGAGSEETRLTFSDLAELETRVESQAAVSAPEWSPLLDRSAAALARRLVARGRENNPGFLVLNPCSFNRRVALELPGVATPLPPGGPVKASQLDPDAARVVVEVPALGFAWVPNPGTPGPPPPSGRMRLADANCVRNEYLEAEVDTQTGGLRALRDQRTRASRLGQQLVFHPGSTMRARAVRVISSGPALGEIQSEGELLDEHGQPLATFRQRFRAWVGRPVLEMRVEVQPVQPPQGYPWHAYYAARFAWRDERQTLLRGVNGTAYVTSHTRPESPDFLELRQGRQNTVLFPQGLPFHQRQGGRMLDVLLITEGETARVFDLGIGLDRDQPMQTALGLVTPVPVVPTTQGPPHVGATGWLFHVDAPNLVLTNLRPVGPDTDAVTARFLECAGHAGPAELRCVRDPRRAVLLDACGNDLLDLPVQGDAVLLDVARQDLVQLRVEFR